MTKKRNPTITRDESSASNESSDTIATSTSQNQNVQDSSGGIDNQTRMYIDIVIQSTTEAIMRNMQQMMNQQIKNQRQWNTQCMETINQRFERLEQMNIQSDDISGNRNKDSGQMTVESNQQGPIETNRELNTSQGNYSPSPIINNLIIKVSLEGADENGARTYKIMGRKYPTINYEAVKEILSVQGFQNPKAAETERIRLWWVMNWTEGQKIIETIPQKPSLYNKLWKTVALGAFVNLHEFMQKSLIDSTKDMNDDTALEMIDGGAIYIRKQKRSAVFENISEWLLAFKAYMDAVLIIYENREQELNTYRDYINELCVIYKFAAVMRYHEERRVALVMDRDSTLLERNIKAEGKSFDATSAKKSKEEWHRSVYINTQWFDGKEICINWNHRTCPKKRSCGKIHTCIVCKKLGHSEKNCFRKQPRKQE
ncbi:hypothetical protein C2G38_2137789 [Gigaspora rosea]|uniref:CCHC-type domain-containing protein n=1 Tax=Gigaspora rosea TaxID=44941 RepID=A0A397VZX5_9GLOM|nr:hypothetical protein C2G38_2137789 [Gigaspora rosea]